MVIDLLSEKGRNEGKEGERGGGGTINMKGIDGRLFLKNCYITTLQYTAVLLFVPLWHIKLEVVAIFTLSEFLTTYHRVFCRCTKD